jgi:UDP-2,3-diacylglucosamine pyrophosphatase LpxH
MSDLAFDQRVYVVSDMHIGDGGTGDPFCGKDRLLRSFLEHVEREADALVIAGDGVDLAQAWSIERIRAAHRELIDELGALGRRLPVHYLQGNHDEPASALRALLPTLRYGRQLSVGDRIWIEHGNVFDPRNQPGDRAAFWGARVHTLIERVLHSPVRIPMRHHYYWSTRFGHWVFFRYGWYLAQKARALRLLGRERQARRCLEFVDYWGRAEWGDIHGLLRPADDFLAASSCETLICGHAHQAGRVSLPHGTYVNTGSWTYDDTTYAVCEGGEVQVLDWRTGRAIEDEEYRGILGPYRDRSFFDWWEAFYDGWWRYDVPAMERAVRGEPCLK